jgi:hypothetical protein
MNDDFDGTWYLDLTSVTSVTTAPNPSADTTIPRRLVMRMTSAEANDVYQISIGDEGDPRRNEARFDRRPASRDLSFEYQYSKETRRCIKGTIVEGVFIGTLSESGGAGATLNWAPTANVVGWNRDYIDSDPAKPDVRSPTLWPRAFTLKKEGNQQAVVTIDCGPPGPVGSTTKCGRIKFYDVPGSLEFDIDPAGIKWNGHTLSFVEPRSGKKFSGLVQDRSLVPKPDDMLAGWWTNAERAEVLVFGIAKNPARLAAWQLRTRKQLRHLMAPVFVTPANVGTATKLNALPGFLRPNALVTGRDDFVSAAGGALPRDYELWEVSFSYSVYSPFSDKSQSITRSVHGYISYPLPLQVLPIDNYRAVIAVNGNGAEGNWGTAAFSMMSLDGPTQGYWYGDAFARRKYIVFAIDIAEDKSSKDAFENGVLDGPKICDVVAAADLLTGRGLLPGKPQASLVNPEKILITGESMGGRVATKAAAVDSRLCVCIAGWANDLASKVKTEDKLAPNDPPSLGQNLWKYANIAEYINTADLHALVLSSPKGGLVLHCGSGNGGNTPKETSKQLARRARDISGPSNFVQFIDQQGDIYRWGGFEATGVPHFPQGIFEPDVQGPPHPPGTPGNTAWQSDWTLKSTPIATDLGALIDATLMPP